MCFSLTVHPDGIVLENEMLGVGSCVKLAVRHVDFKS